MPAGRRNSTFLLEGVNRGLNQLYPDTCRVLFCFFVVLIYVISATPLESSVKNNNLKIGILLEFEMCHLNCTSTLVFLLLPSQLLV